jgi:hypothetical protein
MSGIVSCSATDTPKKKGAAAQRELSNIRASSQSIAAQVDDRVISSCASEMSVAVVLDHSLAAHDERSSIVSRPS